MADETLTSASPPPYRVIQWFTGNVASEQIRQVHQRADLDLVGAVAYHPEKAGRDVGVIAGIGPVGVTVTADTSEALAIEADCVLLNHLTWDPHLIASILESGKNVITIMGAWYLNHEPERDLLETACQVGRSSLLGTGNMPGLVNEAMPLFAAQFCSEVSSIWTRERTCEEDWASADVLQGQLGFGLTAEEFTDGPSGAATAALYEWAMRQPAHLVADVLGVPLEEFRLTAHDVVLAPRDLHLAASGLTIRRGTVAGFRNVYSGFVAGDPWYTFEVENVAVLGLGKDWREHREQPDWTAVIEGNPSLKLDLGSATGELASMYRLLNGSRVVNLVPALCEAAPGCRTFLDLPLSFPRSTGSRTGYLERN